MLNGCRIAAESETQCSLQRIAGTKVEKWYVAQSPKIKH